MLIGLCSYKNVLAIWGHSRWKLTLIQIVSLRAFSFVLTAILNSQEGCRCTLVPRLPFPVLRSPFPVLVTSPRLSNLTHNRQRQERKLYKCRNNSIISITMFHASSVGLRYSLVFICFSFSQPRSQGLSSSHKREWSKKDPGLGWSRVLLTKLSSWEGFQFCRKLSPLAFVTSKPRLEQSPCFSRVFIVRFHVAATGMLI